MHYLCRMQNAPDWLTVNDAAALVGKSLSTMRRALPEIPADHIRRVPIPGKGGERVLIARAYLFEKFGGADVPGIGAPDQVAHAPQLIEILERQILAKDRQIEHLQRDAEAKTRQMEVAAENTARLNDTLQQFAALNAALQAKILLLTEKAEATQNATATPLDTPTQTPWYIIVLFVLAALAAAFLITLLIQ